MNKINTSQEKETPNQTVETTEPTNQLKETLASQSALISQMQRQIDLLTKSADVNRLERVTPKNEDGSVEFKVSTYRPTSDAEPKLIVYWRTLANEVTPMKGYIEERQVIEIELFDGERVRLGDIAGYKDFFGSIAKKPFRLLENKIHYKTRKVDGVLKIEGIEYIEVPWAGKEYKILSPFIN